MSFTPDELEEMKFYLGYGNLTVLARPYFDIALVFADVVAANTSTWGENEVRTNIFPKLRQLRTDVYNARTRYQAKELVGDVILNDQEHQKLVGLYEWWIDQLVDVVKVKRAQHRDSTVEVF